MASRAERKKKYFAKLKGRIGEDQYKEKEYWKGKKILIWYERKTENDKNGNRERKNAGKTTITYPAYKKTSTLTRAMRKAASTLPNSPRKHSQVVQKLFEETCCSTSRSPVKTLGRRSLSKEIVTIVDNFYEQDDISRQAPGKLDTKVVRSVRNETRQRRHLFMTYV